MKYFLILILNIAGFTLYSQTTSYTYDDLNRLTNVVYSDGTVITYQYDRLGNRTGHTITPGIGGGCTPNLVVTGNVMFSTYASQGQLTSYNATVPNSASVDYKSDTAILLDYNFTVELGADFDATIQPCTPGPAPEGNIQPKKIQERAKRDRKKNKG